MLGLPGKKISGLVNQLLLINALNISQVISLPAKNIIS